MATVPPHLPQLYHFHFHFRIRRRGLCGGEQLLLLAITKARNDQLRQLADLLHFDPFRQQPSLPLCVRVAPLRPQFHGELHHRQALRNRVRNREAQRLHPKGLVGQIIEDWCAAHREAPPVVSPKQVVPATGDYHAQNLA